MSSFLVNLRLLTNVILLASLFGSMISALIIYIYDLDSLTNHSIDHNAMDNDHDPMNELEKKTNFNQILTAKIFLYGNYINIIFGTFFLMFNKSNMLISFNLGNLAYFIARILFANNFYFILQWPNLIGFLATSYRYYLDFYDLEGKTTFHVNTELLRRLRKFPSKSERRKRRKRRRRRRKRSLESDFNDESDDDSNEDTS